MACKSRLKIASWLVAFGAISLVPQLSKAETGDRLADMISPVSDPVTFEDPRQSTELRPIFVYHEIGKDFVTGGGNAQVYALQARYKLTDDFSLIATKDGIVVLRPDEAVEDQVGFGDVSAGGKYTLWKNENAIVTTGLRYEIPLGARKVFQGNGQGAINPFVSGAISLCNLNLMAGTGLRQALDDTDSSLWDLNLHADYKIENFYPLVEFSLIHPYQAGDRLPIADEGEDYFNFGASQSAGQNIVTMAVGARYRITDQIDLGAAYQFPLDRGEGSNIIDWRITSDVIFRF